MPGRIINENDVITLLQGKVDYIKQQLEINAKDLEHNTGITASVLRVEKMKFQAQKEVLEATLIHLKYITPYKAPGPQPLHELLAEDENVGSVPNLPDEECTKARSK